MTSSSPSMVVSRCRNQGITVMPGRSQESSVVAAFKALFFFSHCRAERRVAVELSTESARLDGAFRNFLKWMTKLAFCYSVNSSDGKTAKRCFDYEAVWLIIKRCWQAVWATTKGCCGEKWCLDPGMLWSRKQYSWYQAMQTTPGNLVNSKQHVVI